LIFLVPVLGFCQDKKILNNSTDQGVHFEEKLTWQQIQAKAKAEGKYIFIDCYTRSCRRCEKMDQNIYSADSVGKLINGRFISVKIQMDSSTRDNVHIQAWYAVAHQLMVDYKISIFPTFLFLAPDGKIVHRGLYYHGSQDFLELSLNACDPNKQFYTLLARYNAGDKDYSRMPYLAQTAGELNDLMTARAVATDYLHHYLDRLSLQEIYRQANLDFLVTYPKLLNSKDKAFQVFYRHSTLVDSLMQDKGLSRRFVDFIIMREEIDPEIIIAEKKSTEPDWGRIGRHIKHRFGFSYVEENIINAKVDWYESRKQWILYAEYLVKQMDLQGFESLPNNRQGRNRLNNAAWDVFRYSNNKQDLEKALVWSDRVILMGKACDGNELDTKANILYKLGRKEEALALESTAIALDPKDERLIVGFEKMKSGEPTWVINLN